MPALRDHLPLPVRASLRHIRRAAAVTARGWADSRTWRSIARIERFRNFHVGERCFILGNGPSLARTDLSRLRGEVTFGLNRIYLLFDRVGFTTTFYVAVNRLVIEQCSEEIAALTMPKFISWEWRDRLQFTKNTMLIRRWPGLAFSDDVSHGYWEGSTVTYVALQIAFFMGFSEVVLVGVDHCFSAKGPAHEEVVSKGEDRDHFDPSYFGRGFRWHLPDLETSELAYRLADFSYREAGRRVLDATVDGRLEVFPKVSLDEVFGRHG